MMMERVQGRPEARFEAKSLLSGRPEARFEAKRYCPPPLGRICNPTAVNISI